MELILKYFPDLQPRQINHFRELMKILPVLNQQVNVISRKDMDHLEERHVLHSLSIAKKFQFQAGSRVVDAGTGGGFPGIPLAILFPETDFFLVDSIGKKIRVVEEMIRKLELKNVVAINERMEQLELKTDFVVSRAVAPFPKLFQWTQRMIEPGHRDPMPNGLIALKGGDLEKELIPVKKQTELFPISNWFEEPFFSTKMIVYQKK